MHLSNHTPKSNKNTRNGCNICINGTKNQLINFEWLPELKTTLPCNHTFHSSCILEYIIDCIKQNKEKKCPDCRRVIDNNFFYE